jgi:hypothetical protein
MGHVTLDTVAAAAAATTIATRPLIAAAAPTRLLTNIQKPQILLGGAHSGHGEVEFKG